MVNERIYEPTKRVKKSDKKSLSKEEINTEKILIENFVALQRVMTHLSEKFDNLATQISKMLNLFEISAKSLAEKEFDKNENAQEVKKIVEKLDGLLEQNGIIAKGLLLIHDEISPEKEVVIQKPETITFVPRAPKMVAPPSERYPPLQAPAPPSERYQRSISSEWKGNSPPSPSSPRFKPLTKEGNG